MQYSDATGELQCLEASDAELSSGVFLWKIRLLATLLLLSRQAWRKGRSFAAKFGAGGVSRRDFCAFHGVKEPAAAGRVFPCRRARFGPSPFQILPKLWRCRNNKRKTSNFPLKSFIV
jgi:hypothetical protein